MRLQDRDDRSRLSRARPRAAGELDAPFASAMPFVVGVSAATAAPADACLDVALLTALKSAQVAGATTLFLGVQVLQRYFEDDGSSRGPAGDRAKLRRALEAADSLILAASSRDGALSPVLREALCLARAGKTARLALPGERAVACIAAAGDQRVADWALTSLRTTVHEFGGWPTPTGVAIDLSSRPFHATGTCSQEKIRDGLRQCGQQVVAFANSQAAARHGRRYAAA